MRRYEVVFVLAPTLAEEEVDQAVEMYSNVATEMGAEVVETDKWGKRRMAFPVKKHNEGYYTILTLNEPEGKATAELERRFKVNDAVIRFLTVRMDEELKRAEKFEQRREARQVRRGRTRKPETETAAESEEE